MSAVASGPKVLDARPWFLGLDLEFHVLGLQLQVPGARFQCIH